MSTVLLKDPEPDAPGPGMYDPYPSSSFQSPNASPKGIRINPITVISPVSPGRAAAAVSNPSLQKMSVPSIPSRFLTPIIDGVDDSADASGDICKMSRLVDDPTKVGPGTYQISEEQTRSSPRAAINWQNSLTKREGIKASRNTQETVGPGSYNGSVASYKPSAPFFSRQGMSQTHHKGKVHRGAAASSIRGNYYDDESDDNTTPGPGSYTVDTSMFKQAHHSRTSSVQLFGSSVKRFNEKHMDSGLGPGQYKPKAVIGAKFNSVLRVAGSASFKTPLREDQINGSSFDLPGPGDYTG